jgi:hypothetical protein
MKSIEGGWDERDISEMRNAHRILVDNLKGRDRSENLGVGNR